METIAEIQPNTLETLKVREAKKGQLNPKAKHNEAITILFKPGMEGSIHNMEGAVKKWARHNGITGIKWKGTNGEQFSLDEQLGMREERIAKWILHGKEAYPWYASQGDKEMETHELHWNLSGLLYESVTRGWKDLGADKNSIRELQEKYAKTVIMEMTKFIKTREQIIERLLTSRGMK